MSNFHSQSAGPVEGTDRPGFGLNMRRLALLGVLGAVALVGAGCGDDESTSSDSGSSSGEAVPAELAKLVEEAEGTITEWPGPTEGPVAEEGKSIVSIPCARVAYGCARIDDGVKAAGEVLGWDVLSIDPQGDPQKANEAVEQAIKMDADGIVVGALDPELLKTSIANARAAGIPVVDPVAAREPSDTGINHDVEIDGTRQGEILGAYIATASDGQAKVGIMDDEEFPHQALRTGGIESSLDQCSGCEIVGQENFVVSEIGTKLGPKSQAFVQANPDIDWLSVAFDAAAADVVIANQQAGARDVKIVSMDGNPQNLDFIEQGQQQATVAAPLDWAGWAAVDNLNRIFNGEEPVEDDGIPSRLVTPDNIADFRENGFGPVDYEEQYTELWETGKTS